MFSVDTWLFVFFGAVVIIVAVALSVLIAALLDRIQAGSDGETGTEDDIDLSDIRAALVPFIVQGILAGEKLAQAGLEKFDAVLTGADKAEIANSVYNLLPDVVFVGGKAVPIGFIKTFVTPAVFAGWVKTTYDSAHAFVQRNQDYLAKYTDAFVDDLQTSILN